VLSFGSPFPVRFVFGGLLFLKPLGTFFTMPAVAIFVNRKSGYGNGFSSEMWPFISNGLQEKPRG
jgi:hypothetical protein